MYHQNVGRCDVFKDLTPYNADGCIDNGFCGEPIGQAVLPSKNVVRLRVDLASSVRQNCIASDGSSHDLINLACPLALPVNFLTSDVRCFGSTEI